jgi:hypothetical protein
MLLWNFLQFISLLQEASKGQRADALTPQQRREKCAPSGLGPFVFSRVMLPSLCFPASCFRLAAGTLPVSY